MGWLYIHWLRKMFFSLEWRVQFCLLVCRTYPSLSTVNKEKNRTDQRSSLLVDTRETQQSVSALLIGTLCLSLHCSVGHCLHCSVGHSVPALICEPLCLSLHCSVGHSVYALLCGNLCLNCSMDTLSALLRGPLCLHCSVGHTVCVCTTLWDTVSALLCGTLCTVLWATLSVSVLLCGPLCRHSSVGHSV